MGASVQGAKHRIGEPIVFSGYVDDFEGGISAIEFSLDEGRTWTAYETPGTLSERGVNWSFAYTPEQAGRYLLKVRAVDERGRAASVVSGYAFEVQPSVMGASRVPEVFGGFRLRAVGGGSLRGARLFRSCQLAGITDSEARFLVGELGVKSVYDIRNQWEVADAPEPYLMGVKTVALEPDCERRRKNTASRLTAGVIREYGAPEERMLRNYRRYAREYPLIGATLRSIAAEGAPALVHCVNGKDRTGVLCAVLMRVAGAHPDEVMEDFLATNLVNADLISRERVDLGAGMTDEEDAILASFLEVRPTYLNAFFDEAKTCYGSFERYVSEGLRLNTTMCGRLAMLLSRPEGSASR